MPWLVFCLSVETITMCSKKVSILVSFSQLSKPDMSENIEKVIKQSFFIFNWKKEVAMPHICLLKDKKEF